MKNLKSFNEFLDEGVFEKINKNMMNADLEKTGEEFDKAERKTNNPKIKELIRGMKENSRHAKELANELNNKDNSSSKKNLKILRYVFKTYTKTLYSLFKIHF